MEVAMFGPRNDDPPTLRLWKPPDEAKTVITAPDTPTQTAGEAIAGDRRRQDLNAGTGRPMPYAAQDFR